VFSLDISKNTVSDNHFNRFPFKLNDSNEGKCKKASLSIRLILRINLTNNLRIETQLL